jgi:hypothetical protein
MWIFQNTERKPLAQPINSLLAAKDRQDADVPANAGASMYSRKHPAPWEKEQAIPCPAAYGGVFGSHFFSKRRSNTSIDMASNADKTLPHTIFA